MSKKNRKLGRGLQDLLNQRESSVEPQTNDFLEDKENDKVYGGNIDVMSETVSPKTFSGELASDGVKYTASFLGKSDNQVEDEEKNDSETFRFHSMKNDLADVTNEVKALSEEVESFKAETDAESAGSSDTKTLMDYMNSTDDVPLTKTIKPEILTFSDEKPISSRVTEAENTEDVDRIYNISVSLIDSNPWQPREIFQSKEINELAESIKTHGLLQPIVVREFRGRYQLVAGERRFRAALKLTWTQVPATIIDATDREMAELALVENLQRKDLNPIEKANSFEKYQKANHCTQEEMAKRLSMDRSTISNLQRLLTLPSEVQQMVIDEKLTQGHARSILTLTKSQDQIEMAKRIANEKLSVRQTEQIISEWNDKTVAERKEDTITKVAAPSTSNRKKEKSPQILDLERQLQDLLDLKVKITSDSNGKGKMEIYFKNNDDFSSLMDYFKG